jgi:MoaA/NifB/PqqE/SkfB family radical SAM enzyme
MSSVEVKVGVVCNNSCIFCFNEIRDWQKSLEEIKEEVIQAKNAGADMINFTGGEITIRRDFFDMIQFARNQGLKVSLQTNGRAFYYKKFAEQVCAWGIDFFLISLHADSAARYKKLCGVDGYGQVIDGIKNLLDLKQSITLNCVLSKQNIRKARQIAEHHAALGVGRLQFGWVTPKGRALSGLDVLVPAFKESIGFLFDALDWLDKNYSGIVQTTGIPVCILQKRHYFKGIEYSDQFVVKNGRLDKLSFNGVLQGKVKTNLCSSCIYNDVCEGVFNEYINSFGDEEFKPIDEPVLNILGVVGFFPKENNDEIPNYGANRVTNELLLNIQKSNKIDKLIFFVEEKDYERNKVSQNEKIKVLPLNAIVYYSRNLEKDFLAFYCIHRQYLKTLETYGFKKIALIHSQDTPDILESYGKYVFGCNKNNCWWISPSKAGKSIALDIFAEFEKYKGSKYNHRIQVIPWGIPSIGTVGRDINRKVIKLLYLGRINSLYKADLLPLFQVFEKLKKDYADIELHLAGDITREESERLSRYFGNGVFYHGVIPEKEKAGFISKHDIFVSPVNSIQETFGITLLEAAAQGLVCIGTDWNGYNEILKTENLIVKEAKVPDIKIPVGIMHVGKYVGLSRRISLHIKIDWDDCYVKIKRAINCVRSNNIEPSLLHDIERYLWENILKEHEALWFSEDNHILDKTTEFVKGIEIPSSIFFSKH